MKTFPGMNPYIEYPHHWRGFHNLLASEILAQLNPQIYPAYIAELEVYTILQNVQISDTSGAYPDIAVYEQANDADFVQSRIATITQPSFRVPTLVEATTKGREIRLYTTKSRELVTTIEILSPANKTGSGLIQYREKRDKILRSAVHLVEIDLLRGGERPGRELEGLTATDYTLLINRATTNRFSDIWEVALNQSLPTIPVPLLYPDPDVPLDLHQVLATIYTRYLYQAVLDYDQPPAPPKLRRPMQQWWQEQFEETL